MQPRRKRRAGDVESVQTSVLQTFANSAAQVEPIFSPYNSAVIREVSPTNPRIRPAHQNPNEGLFNDKNDFQKNLKDF